MSDRYLLVKGRAGMGNRMLCALTAALYARLSGRRLVVDWTDGCYAPLGENAFHRCFRSPLCDPADEIPATDSVAPPVWRGHLRETACDLQTRVGKLPVRDSWREFSIDLTRLDHDAEVAVMWTFWAKIELLRGHMQGEFAGLLGESRETILARILREDVVLHPAIRERVDRFIAGKFRRPVVGVHCRYSDHRAHLGGILKALDAMLAQAPGLQVFLATDNIRVHELFEKNYPGTIATSHWYPPPGARPHGDATCPDLAENAAEALVDMYLLAACDRMVIDTSSSFSYVAQVLSAAPASGIVDVKRAEKMSPRLRQLLWRVWKVLGLYDWGLRLFARLRARRRPGGAREGGS